METSTPPSLQLQAIDLDQRSSKTQSVSSKLHSLSLFIELIFKTLTWKKQSSLMTSWLLMYIKLKGYIWLTSTHPLLVGLILKMTTNGHFCSVFLVLSQLTFRSKSKPKGGNKLVNVAFRERQNLFFEHAFNSLLKRSFLPIGGGWISVGTLC